MFLQNKREKPNPEVNKEQNLISPGTKITGDIEAQGDFRIDGTVEGAVKTQGKVFIGKTGFIEGSLECENVDVEGKVKGKLIISGTVNLRSGAVIEGEISTSQLAIAPGATFNASCDMNSEKNAEKPIEKKTEKKPEKKVENKTKKNGSRPGQKQKEEKPA